VILPQNNPNYFIVFPFDKYIVPAGRHDILKGSQGMTLLEVVAILLLLGILAISATTRMTRGTTGLLVTAEGVASHLRLVQTMALNSSPGVRGLRFEPAGNTYYMFHCADPDNCDMDLADNIVALPGVTDENKRFAVSNGGVRLLTDGNVAYDDFGKPHTIAGNQAVPSDDPITVSFEDEAGNTHDIQVIPETGFIP
jgi:hypothetical protein